MSSMSEQLTQRSQASEDYPLSAVPPIGGVVMADYWLRHQGQFPSLNEPQPAFNWAGIIAYVVASAIAYFSPGIKPINGIVAAIVFYFVLSEVMPQSPTSKLTI